MKNKLGYVGFLGLLGVLGFFTDNRSYLAFFGFLYFFRYFGVIPDELFKENVRRAASPSFFISMAIYAVTVALTAFHAGTMIFVAGLVAGFVIPICVFIVLLVVFEYRESGNAKS